MGGGARPSGRAPGRRGSRGRIAAATLVVHAGLAAAVALDARGTDRDAGRWGLVTLATGVFGALAYVLTR
ncbi:hypothetical protein [Halorarum halobium]|uniref:hypothetical protein n=1 Tax=Halorarum halobium TaxID=3075121 RepID=UPI0028AE56BE|nr:hypothetical protein [Halobaculum sp. XH14]